VVVALRAKSETASVGAASNLLIERLLIVLAPACERGNAVVAIIAKKIIELAKAGEHNPDLLCERALMDLRESPPRA